MGLYEASKDVANVLKEAGKIEEYKQILELLDKLLELQKKNIDLETENKDLKEKIRTKEKLAYRNNSYWIGEDGPFCSRCFDKNMELLRMHPTFIESNNVKCPECETIVNFTGIENSNSQNIKAARMASMTRRVN